MENTPKKPYSSYFYNPLTYFGATLATFFFLIECILFGLDFFAKEHSVYLGIITYVLLPPGIIIGLVLIPIGAIRKYRRVQKGIPDEKPRPFQIDFTKASHRNALFVFVVGTIILVIMTAIGTYKAYQYTESVKFCGTTCHNIMIPEYVAYNESPHAQVKCVDCHIGEGADAYLRYKLAGVRQLYHTIKKDYAKPIPTPVHNLRPAAETCEKCHWPGKFYSSIEVKKLSYPTENGTDSPWLIRLLMHVGDDMSNRGIHSHMYINNQVLYAAEDESRQKITWVKSISKEGKVTIYRSPDSKFKDVDPPDNLIRKMDCMDCHNRPAHIFKAPFELVNFAMMQGKIKQEIPNIKSKIMEALSGKYSSMEQAKKEISEKLTDYYQKKHADYYAQNQAIVDEAIAQAVQMYENYFFPEMNTRWDSHAEQIGHLWSPGCFRCHDGEHKSEDGKDITKDCTVCHTIVEQGPIDKIEKNIEGIPFIHPFNQDESWKEMNCSDCHTGN